MENSRRRAANAIAYRFRSPILAAEHVQMPQAVSEFKPKAPVHSRINGPGQMVYNSKMRPQKICKNRTQASTRRKTLTAVAIATLDWNELQKKSCADQNIDSISLIEKETQPNVSLPEIEADTIPIILSTSKSDQGLQPSKELCFTTSDEHGSCALCLKDPCICFRDSKLQHFQNAGSSGNFEVRPVSLTAQAALQDHPSADIGSWYSQILKDWYLNNSRPIKFNTEKTSLHDTRLQDRSDTSLFSQTNTRSQPNFDIVAAYEGITGRNLGVVKRECIYTMIAQQQRQNVSRESLLAELREIYEGLLVVENHCVTALDHAAASASISAEQLQSILGCHQGYLRLASRAVQAGSINSPVSAEARRLMIRYSMPRRIWHFGFRNLLRTMASWKYDPEIVNAMLSYIEDGIDFVQQIGNDLPHLESDMARYGSLLRDYLLQLTEIRHGRINLSALEVFEPEEREEDCFWMRFSGRLRWLNELIKTGQLDRIANETSTLPLQDADEPDYESEEYRPGPWRMTVNLWQYLGSRLTSNFEDFSEILRILSFARLSPGVRRTYQWLRASLTGTIGREICDKMPDRGQNNNYSKVIDALRRICRLV